MNDISLRERFEQRVDRSPGQGPEGDCHLWKPGGRYGKMRTPYGQLGAHVIAFFLDRGYWAKNQVCHTCDIGTCCNPEHLFDGTGSQNMRDCCSKGRGARQRLRVPQVREIRRRARHESQASLAREFGITSVSINLIVHHKNYAWVP